MIWFILVSLRLIYTAGHTSLPSTNGHSSHPQHILPPESLHAQSSTHPPIKSHDDPPVHWGHAHGENVDNLVNVQKEGVTTRDDGLIIPNGYGTLHLKNGMGLQGVFENGYIKGKGKIITKAGKLKYEGQIENDLPNGEGIQYLENGGKFKGKFIKGEFVLGEIVDKDDHLLFKGIWSVDSEDFL